jgi:hypothetical protein
MSTEHGARVCWGPGRRRHHATVRKQRLNEEKASLCQVETLVPLCSQFRCPRLCVLCCPALALGVKKHSFYLLELLQLLEASQELVRPLVRFHARSSKRLEYSASCLGTGAACTRKIPRLQS